MGHTLRPHATDSRNKKLSALDMNGKRAPPSSILVQRLWSEWELDCASTAALVLSILLLLLLPLLSSRPLTAAPRLSPLPSTSGGWSPPSPHGKLSQTPGAGGDCALQRAQRLRAVMQAHRSASEHNSSLCAENNNVMNKVMLHYILKMVFHQKAAFCQFWLNT